MAGRAGVPNIGQTCYLGSIINFLACGPAEVCPHAEDGEDDGVFAARVTFCLALSDALTALVSCRESVLPRRYVEDVVASWDALNDKSEGSGWIPDVRASVYELRGPGFQERLHFGTRVQNDAGEVLPAMLRAMSRDAPVVVELGVQSAASSVTLQEVVDRAGPFPDSPCVALLVRDRDHQDWHDNGKPFVNRARLLLDPHVTHSSGGEAQSLWRVLAVVAHSGGDNVGHYVCFSKKDAVWVLHDDSSVSLADARALETLERGARLVYLERETYT